MPFSLRLDPDTEARLRRLTAATGRSRTDVVRDAIAHYGAAHEGSARGTAFERLKPFIGVVRSGRGELSTDTHAHYRQRLEQKHRGRRPR